MQTARDTTIRLRLSWRGRPIGAVIPGLDFGVAELLVSRSVAEWAPGAAGTPLGQSPPVATDPALTSLVGDPASLPSVQAAQKATTQPASGRRKRS